MIFVSKRGCSWHREEHSEVCSEEQRRVVVVVVVVPVVMAFEPAVEVEVEAEVLLFV